MLKCNVGIYLYNQYDLISLRSKYGIHKIKPGITGWAQINGRDELSINEKVKADLYYKDNKSFYLNTKIVLFTVFHILLRKGISH